MIEATFRRKKKHALQFDRSTWKKIFELDRSSRSGEKRENFGFFPSKIDFEKNAKNVTRKNVPFRDISFQT